MRRLRLFELVALVAAFATATWGGHGFAAEKATNAASEARLADSVRYLASDELEGRGVGTEGLNRAAEYLAEQFQALGLKTNVFDGTPFQTFTINSSPELGPKERNRLALHTQADGATNTLDLKLGEDFTTLALGGSGAVDLPLVFAGYGITAPEHDYDDYRDLDVRGKAVLVIRKEPRQDREGNVFDGKNPSKHALFTTKVESAAKRGAAAIIFVNDHREVESKRTAEREAWRKAVQELSDANEKFKAAGDDSAEAFARHREEVEKLIARIQEHAKGLDANPDALLAFDQAGDVAKHPELPIFFVRRSVVEPIVAAALGETLAAIEAAIDDDLAPRSAPLEGWRVEGEANVERRKVEVKNVVAVLEGEGPLADETIVLGAHYDHLGRGGAGSLAPWTRDIHNGADDNASGTAALVELAHRLAARGEKLPRRIVFIAFTGEERGLLGSAHYVKQPAFPLEKTIAMINMDMVGRLDNDRLVVYGTGTAEGFDALVDRLNEKHGFRITKNESGHGPSDHTSFYTKGVPVFHLFTGTHRDYHRPSDDFDKINVEGMRRVADLVEDLTIEIAANPERPKYLETRRGRTAERGRWPYFGSVPDYASEAKGLALQDVAKNGPADKGGLQSGDVIVEFGGEAITGIEDFAAVLSKHKGGDRVQVKFQRGGQEMTVEVTLDPPR